MSGWKALCCAAVLTVMTVPSAHADEWNKKTILTFSGPVQIPGATLPAGSYVFKLADLQGNRHVVQVFDKSESKLFTTLLAIPNERLEPADDPLILFAERPTGSPQAVKVWFYPGDRIGNEFVYPKQQAMAIAKANHTSVLGVADNTSSDAYKTAEVGRFDDRGVWQPEGNKAVANNTASSATTTAPKTTTAASTMAKSNTADRNRATGTSGARKTRTTLPRTASELPLFALLSVIALASGLAMRRRRSA